MKVSVVIPTKNEEKSIGEIIDGTKPHADEILVIDGHSKDKTGEIALSKGARVELDGGKGKGEAMRRAIDLVSGDIIVFIDADGSHDPKDIPKLLEPIVSDKVDMVIGSRMKGGSDELMGTFEEFLRLVGGQLITLIINYTLGAHLTDSQNGFRAVRTSAIRQVKLTENITTIEQEMTVKLIKKNFKVIDVAAHETRRKFGESHINLWKASPRYIYSMVKNILWG
jgi:dolichol-phosphate mannosyltransferase